MRTNKFNLLSVLLRIRSLFYLGLGALATMGVLVIGMGLFSLQGASPSNYVDRLINGDDVKAINPLFEARISKSEKSVSLTFTIRNSSNVDVALLGFDNSCSCTVVGRLPPKISAHSETQLTGQVQIDPRNSAKLMAGQIRVFTDNPRKLEIPLYYRIERE